jgi:hypothetical protein
MTPGLLLLGFCLGALGASLHLLVVWLRSRALQRGVAFVLLSYPLGFVGPALAFWAAARIAPEAAWSAVLGLMALRGVVLGRLRRKELS